MKSNLLLKFSCLCILLTCFVGCPAINDGSGNQSLSPKDQARVSIVLYSKLLAEAFDDAALKIEIDELATVRDYGEFITDKNQKARDICFEGIRELLQKEFGEDQEDFDKEKLIQFSKEISQGLKEVN